MFWGREPAAPFGIGEITVVPIGGISSRQRNGKKRAQLFKRAPKLLGLVLIAKCVLIGSSNYFTAGPKRSASSCHEAMILAFVLRAL